ncbi:hypothetical protein [Arenibacter certesii]|uniref:Ferric oxidoreductase domain-containing protein n=1 Tax=Arenibacter certesii TaxID=228955 RepID=A0A918MI37_9FLAO|nr:hypothetical protein [Arenibacter certesii]GGW23404.1 hypothetical protein GCM10007383_04460 [Arenibacter certesii]
MTNKDKEKNIFFITVVVIIAIGYAVLRYHLKGDVPWKDFPIFVLNKGVSLGAITILTLCVSIRPLSTLGIVVFSTRAAKKLLGISGLLMTILHVLLSLLILNPSYFNVFFEENGTLSARGGISLLAGVISFMMLVVYHQCFKNGGVGKERLVNFLTSSKFILGLLLLFGLHLFFLGYHNWMNFANWKGGLPPITLVSFVVISLGVLINVFKR